jgi:ADP-ribose pyrophosphatase YjhB (NUDIX family)
MLLDGNDVLLIQRARPPGVGKWTVPGGKVELGESLEAAAARELKEETGLVATIGPIVEVLDRVVTASDGRIEYHYVILDMLGTEPQGVLTPGPECLDARWVGISELGSYETTDGLEPVIRRALETRDLGVPGPHRVHDQHR